MSNQHSQQQEPDRYWKVQVQGQIQKFILDAFHASKQKVIDRLAITQRDKTNSVTGFRFRGEPFVHSQNSLQPYQLRRLHLSLVDEFQAHVDEWERHTLRQHEVNGYINQVLNRCKTAGDLIALLPQCVYPAIKDKEDMRALSLTQSQIEDFKQEHADGEKLLKMQLILNTLKA